MIGKEITFENLEGKQVTDTFWFHLNKAEMAEQELTAEGGSLAANLQAIVKTGDPGKIIKTFKFILAAAYGVKGDDGVSFIKSEELSRKFMQTDAYSELFWEICTNAQAAFEFIEGVFPAGIKDQMPKTLEEAAAIVDIQLPEETPAEQEPGRLPWADRPPTDAELDTMTKDQLRDVMTRNKPGTLPAAFGG